MAIDDFWRNLRTAASLVAPSATTDWLDADTGAVESHLRAAMIWLTPRSVDGFDPNDFRFLDEDQQVALQESIERFRKVAEQVPGNKPATRLHAKEGRNAFGEILKLLQPHRFKDAESFRMQVLLERELKGQLPDWVTGIDCETGLDLSDEPAIWIWVHVTDDAVDKGKFAKQVLAIHDAVEAAYQRIGGRRWPFVRFQNPDAFAHRKGASA